MLSDKRSVRDLVELCHQAGIRQVVISPGSRNAPLTISFNEHGSFECFSIIDERSAGFFAIGLSQISQIPTIVICTSGSALLNYAPALVEAYYQHIPVLVLSADRPSKWIDQGEGQSMKQNDAFKNFIRKSVNLKEPHEKHFIQKNIAAICNSIDKTISPIPGPVHINIPLEEPLYNVKEYHIAKPKFEKNKIETFNISSHKVSVLRRIWQSSKKILIVTGVLRPSNELNEVLSHVVENNANVVVLTETTSNLSNKAFIGNIDRNLSLLEQYDQDDFAPELLITLGHNLISKKIKYWLRSLKFKDHWHVDEWGDFQNTFEKLTERIHCRPQDLFRKLLSIECVQSSNYSENWLRINEIAKYKHELFVSNCDWSDLKAFDTIINAIPDNSLIQSANSTVVRYLQLYDLNSNWLNYANRGISGIDGCTSTALGACLNSNKLTVFITGDIAFGYDSNAFWHNHLSGNIRIIVISNGGGGIFRFIKGPSTTNQFEEYFETPRSGHVKAIAERYNLHYSYVEDELYLTKLLPSFIVENVENKPKILEVSTPRYQNDKVLKDYFHFISNQKNQ